MKPDTSPPPEGLEKAGLALWALIHAQLGPLDADTGERPFQLTERERAYLELACRQQDLAARLDAEIEETGLTITGSAGQPALNPAVAEARQARVAVERFLSKLALPNGDEKPLTEAGRRAQHAADTRWSAERAKRARREGGL